MWPSRTWHIHKYMPALRRRQDGYFAKSSVPLTVNVAEGRAILTLPSNSCFEINPAT